MLRTVHLAVFTMQVVRGMPMMIRREVMLTRTVVTHRHSPLLMESPPLLLYEAFVFMDRQPGVVAMVTVHMVMSPCCDEVFPAAVHVMNLELPAMLDVGVMRTGGVRAAGRWEVWRWARG